MSLVIQLRGTSGSGKSFVMRRIMEQFTWTPYCEGRRKRPLWYTAPDSKLVVIGGYESAYGGCDSIGSARQSCEVIKRAIEELNPRVVLAEGLLLSEDVKHTTDLGNVKTVFLTTPLETCISQIKSRRAEVGNDKPLNTEKTTRRVATIERARLRLVEAGIICRRCSSNQAPGLVLGWINEEIDHAI